MSINSRSKGASAERELASAIHAELGIRLIRNLEQSRGGGHDLIVDPNETGPVASWLARHAIEIKRHCRATPALLKGWWAQAESQGERCGLIPVLAYRGDRASWRIVLPMSELARELPRWEGIEYSVELSIPAFCALVRERSTEACSAQMAA